MNIPAYLDRIQFHQTPNNDLSSFKKLHYQHVFHIPFENLDIQRGSKLYLEEAHLFQKVVIDKRGGFCYELNYLFYLLLKKLHFDVRMISARIFNEGQEGPPFDHMALLVHFGEVACLADVGFGDLFLQPIPLRTGYTISDDLHTFRLESRSPDSYILHKSENGVDFEKKYIFETAARSIEQFQSMCDWKESSPNSHFVKNKICTLPLINGRQTLFNNKFTRRIDGKKNSVMVESTAFEKQLLAEYFGIAHP